MAINVVSLGLQGNLDLREFHWTRSKKVQTNSLEPGYLINFYLSSALAINWVTEIAIYVKYRDVSTYIYCMYTVIGLR